MTSAVAVYHAPDEVRKDMTALRAQLEDVLPSRIDTDRFLRVVAKTIIENPKLMECTRLSLLSSIHTAAQLGLEPSGLLGSAYLVPYRRSVTVEDDKGRMVKTSVMEAQLIPGYRGLIDLARRSGEVESIEADVVRARDEFLLEKGTNARLIHRPFIADPTASAEERDRGPYVGAYMKAVLRGGVEQYEWMSFDDIEAVRKRSKAATDGPWVTDWSEMARKTVVRRGSKYLPLTTDFRTALELDEQAERDAESPFAGSQPSRAARMLLDRASLRVEGQDGQRPLDASDNPASDQSGPLDASDEPEQQTRELRPVIEAREAEGTDGPSRAEVEAEAAGTPTPACGDVNPDMGACTRAPGHGGGHRNAQGVWPRA